MPCCLHCNWDTPRATFSLSDQTLPFYFQLYHNLFWVHSPILGLSLSLNDHTQFPPPQRPNLSELLQELGLAVRKEGDLGSRYDSKREMQYCKNKILVQMGLSSLR